MYSLPCQDWKRGRSAQQLDTPVPLPKRDRQAKRPGQNLVNLVVPQSALEWRMIAAISAVRFGFVPICTFAVVMGFQSLGWMPADPVCKLAILLQVRLLIPEPFSLPLPGV